MGQIFPQYLTHTNLLKPTAGLVAVGVESRGVLWGWASGFEPVGDIGCESRWWAGGGELFAVWFFFVVVEVVGLAQVVSD